MPNPAPKPMVEINILIVSYDGKLASSKDKATEKLSHPITDETIPTLGKRQSRVTRPSKFSLLHTITLTSQ